MYLCTFGIPFYYIASVQDGSNYTNKVTIKGSKGSPIQSQVQELNTKVSQLDYYCQDIYFEEMSSLDVENIPSEDNSQIKWLTHTRNI